MFSTFYEKVLSVVIPRGYMLKNDQYCDIFNSTTDQHIRCSRFFKAGFIIGCSYNNRKIRIAKGDNDGKFK